MTQRGLSLHLPVVSSLDGGNLIYFALNCTTEDRIPQGGDARAARVMAIPFLRLRTSADKFSPHPDEYCPLSAMMPLWVERGSLSMGGTLRAFFATNVQAWATDLSQASSCLEFRECARELVRRRHVPTREI